MVNPLHNVLQKGNVGKCRFRGCKANAQKWQGGWWCDEHAWMDIGPTGLPGGLKVGVFALKLIPEGTELINYKQYAQCYTKEQWAQYVGERRYINHLAEKHQKAMEVCPPTQRPHNTSLAYPRSSSNSMGDSTNRRMRR